jgi:hypothetical protein
MSECLSAIPVKKGDALRLEANYDEIAHPLSVALRFLLVIFANCIRRVSHGMEQEEMGFMVFTFTPAKA